MVSFDSIRSPIQVSQGRLPDLHAANYKERMYARRVTSLAALASCASWLGAGPDLACPDGTQTAEISDRRKLDGSHKRPAFP